MELGNEMSQDDLFRLSPLPSHRCKGKTVLPKAPDGEIAQPVRDLLPEQEDLSSSPKATLKMPDMVGYPYHSRAEKAEASIPRVGLLAFLSSRSVRESL